MSVLFVLVPVALGVVLMAVAGFVWSARTGQFDDLTTPSLRPLIDDVSENRPMTSPGEDHPLTGN